MRVLRAIPFLVLALVLTALGFVASVAALALGPRRGVAADAIARLWGHALLVAAGARVVVTGAGRVPRGRPHVVVANHASYLDIPALFHAVPAQLRFVARSTLVWLPFVGWYIRAAHFSVDRDDPRQAKALLERVARRMQRDGLSPVLFPEGTRSRDGRLAALKPGSFLLPVSTGVAVLPVALLGTHEVLPKGAWAPRRGGTVEVRIGEPIDVAPYEGSLGRKALAERVRQALVALGAPQGPAEEEAAGEEVSA